MKKIFLITLFMFLFISHDEIFAVTVNNDGVLPTLDSTNFKQGEPAVCFDYYSFGSIDINLQSDMSSYNSGDHVVISGKILNNNRYPIVGLDIKARIVKNIPNPEYLRSEIMILEEFDIVDNVNIGAGAEYDVSYNHILPFNAPSGKYEVYFYAVEQDRFNMSGLYFTNDIIGSKLSFDVKGSVPDHVYLDQTKITVGGQDHNVMAFITQHLAGVQVPINIPLYNPHNIPMKMSVSYDLYSWDNANPKNKIDTKTEIVTVPPRSSYDLKYIIEKTDLPVYYISIIAEPADNTKDKTIYSEKTISNIRLSVDQKSKPRLNFTAIDVYPLKSGFPATLVTCFHNTNFSTDDSISKIETVLKDSDGNEIAKTLYEGKLISDISGLIQKFTPESDIVDFTIVSTIYDEKNNIIDMVEKKYSCKDLDPSICPKNIFFNKIMVLLMSILILITIFTIIFIKNRKLNH